MKQIDRIREMEACLDISAAAARALSDALDQFETARNPIKSSVIITEAAAG